MNLRGETSAIIAADHLAETFDCSAEEAELLDRCLSNDRRFGWNLTFYSHDQFSDRVASADRRLERTIKNYLRCRFLKRSLVAGYRHLAGERNRHHLLLAEPDFDFR